jgi:peptide/nickel transport system permease protein
MTAATMRRGLAVRLPKVLRRPTIIVALFVLAVIVLGASFAPWIAGADPLELRSMQRLAPPGALHLFGTDMLGRDVFARTLYGGRISLVIGVCVAAITVLVGLLIGLIAGFVRWTDAILMRVMDGLQAIPAILLAIGIAAVAGGGLFSVILAITIAETPLVVRLVRAMALTIREEPYIEAARSMAIPMPAILLRHVIPNMVGALIVQATYICGVTILFEAYLSFLGAGISPETPSWGNIMAEGRTVALLAPWVVAFPGLCVALVVLALNELGDGLQDHLDPRIRKRL